LGASLRLTFEIALKVLSFQVPIVAVISGVSSLAIRHVPMTYAAFPLCSGHQFVENTAFRRRMLAIATAAQLFKLMRQHL
jgi:hypothetical protein